MKNKILVIDVENTMNKYIGAYFDAIQEVLDKKETSLDINLDIQMKIFSKVHYTLVELKKDLLKNV